MSTVDKSLPAITISSDKRLLLNKWLKGESQKRNICKVPRDGPLPLSFAQQRLWLIHQLEPGSTAYNLAYGLRFIGRLDKRALQLSLNEIVRRHEVLRTRFVTRDAQPVQEIIPELSWVIEDEEVSGLRPDEEAPEIDRRLRKEAAKPFDLARGPLLRTKLLKLREHDYVLLVIMHHIVSDGWSIGIMVHEFSALYDAYVKGRPSPLPELTIQYGDFAVWQREWLHDDVLDQQLSYWRKQLAGSEPLELASDHVRPPGVSHPGRRVALRLDAQLTQKLKALCRQERATLFMTLLAAFQVVLARYSRQQDVTVGTAIANRNRPEIEALIGFFVNTLVLRTSVDAALSFAELLKRVRQTTLQAYQHQDVPFEKVVEELLPDRDPYRNPLFQIMFVLQNTPATTLALPGLRIEALRPGQDSVHLDMTMMIWESEERVDSVLEYNASLWEEKFAERLLAHWKTLLESGVANPSSPVFELAMLTPEEEYEVLNHWNEGLQLEANQRWIHELLEEQARRTPGAIACQEPAGRQMSYAELNHRANQVAHYLRELGVGPEVRVGLCLPRSLELLVGMLGILKAGGAYVPLDPAYPAERLQYMVEDSGAAVVVSSGAMRLSGSVPVVRLDEEWNTIACRSGADAGVKLEGENLAYVIYTSGSTGRQKGVGIRHSSAGVLVQWAQQEYSGEETAVVLAATSVCFDLSVYEIFVPLSRGGKVVVVENALELAKLEGGAGITLVNTVPSAMAELVRSRSLPEGLRVVNLAGEALPPSLVQQVYGQAGGVRVMNLYGPTEDTTYSTYEWVKVEEARGGRVSIGRPVANTQAYVLDGQMQPVGAGMRGELYLGGEGLARGYVNRPELTAEKFVPHPYGGRGGERLYRTGDLVRWREDGKLEFLGRADHQVKLRGYRIELGEIEAVLREHAGVEEAVVVVREGRGGDRRLVAYYTVRKEKEGREEGGDGVGAEELRVYIGEKLPGYMIPAAYVRLPKLPLTANGKLDRKALPAPDKKQESEQSEYIAPRTRLEEVLAHIWAQVLGVTRVGVKDDFFALGGNSLSAMRLLALTEARFGKKLPLAAVLRKPTIEQFIALFQDQNDNAGSSCLVPLRTTGSRRPLFFVHPIGGNVYCYRGLANLMNKERPIYAFQSQAFTGLPPHSSIAEMAEAYLNEMIAFQPNGPYFLTGWSMGGVVAFEMARQLKSRKLPVALLALIDSYPGFLHKEWNLDDHLTALISFARDLGLTAQELATLRDNEPGLTEDQMLQSVIRCVNDNEMLPRELESGEAIRMFDVFKRNAAALHSYEPQGFYEEKILLFKAAIRPRNIDLKKAWSRICSNVESHVIPGDHYAILRRPGVEILAERLDSTLEFAETGLKAKKSA